jgi:alpha-beta hydrolase superfamily lysophospholipase
MARSEELRFRAGDTTLAGTLTVPEEGAGAPARHPWALLLSSWLPRTRDGGPDRGRHGSWYAPATRDESPGLLWRLAEALADRGVASLRYDPRGCGESGGSWESSDLFTRIDDARDAIGAMRSRPGLDLRRTAIVGHGEGSGIALSVAIGDPAIGAVGLIGASARSLRDVLRRGAAERRRTGTDHQHPAVDSLDRAAEELIERAERREAELAMDIGGEHVTLGLRGWEQAIHTPPFALATMLHRNVVLAHGTRDAWAHPDETRLLAAVLADAGNRPDMRMVEDAGHDLAEVDDAEIGALADALVARIEPRELPPVLVAIEEMGSTTG